MCSQWKLEFDPDPLDFLWKDWNKQLWEKNLLVRASKEQMCSVNWCGDSEVCLLDVRGIAYCVAL